jgi:hypothetical protein
MAAASSPTQCNGTVGRVGVLENRREPILGDEGGEAPGNVWYLVAAKLRNSTCPIHCDEVLGWDEPQKGKPICAISGLASYSDRNHLVVHRKYAVAASEPVAMTTGTS